MQSGSFYKRYFNLSLFSVASVVAPSIALSLYISLVIIMRCSYSHAVWNRASCQILLAKEYGKNEKKNDVDDDGGGNN